MKYPVFIKKGSTIGICAPSAGVGNKLEHFQTSLDNLKSYGFKIVETASVRSKNIRSASGKKRAQEFMQLYKDNKVDFVLCAAGGDFLMECLPYIDFEVVSKNPKWFMGMSDPSTLLFILPTVYDIASLYACNAGSFDYDKRVKKAIDNCLSYMQGNLVKQNSFKQYLIGFGEDLAADKVYWQTVNGEVDIQGRLIGGCIDALRDIIGTKYDCVKQFNLRYQEDGIIWFIDNFALSAEDFYHTLWQMNENEWFSNVKGIILGRHCFPSSNTGMSYIQAIKKIFGKNIPLVSEADIGHVSPSMTFINGGYIHLKAKDGKGSVSFELR